MPLSFCDLSPDIHLEISSYLPGDSNKNVSRTCSSVRLIYQKASWKTCIIAKFDRSPFASTKQKYGYNRFVPLTVLRYPQKYKSWFRTEAIEVIQFDFEFPSWKEKIKNSNAVINSSTIKLFPSLRKIDMNDCRWVDVQKVLEKNVIRNVPNAKIFQISFSGSETWGKDDEKMNRIVELNIKLSKDNQINKVPSLISNLPNLTKLQIFEKSDLMENVVTCLNSVPFPSLQDLTLQLAIGFTYDSRPSVFSNLKLESLSSLDSAPFIKHLKRFELNFLPCRSKKYNIGSHSAGGTKIKRITVSKATHVTLSYHITGENMALLIDIFNFPNATHMTVCDWTNIEQFGKIDHWISMFAHLTYLSLDMTFHYIFENDKTPILDYIYPQITN